MSSRGSWETITEALERAVGPGRPSGAWTKYCCPHHEGDGGHHKPSLAVKYDQAAQRTVVRCFAGCDNEQVLDAVGLGVRDMFDRPLEPRHRAGGRDRVRRPRTPARPVSRAEAAITAAGLPLRPVKRERGAQTSPWRAVATYPYAREDGTVAGEVIRREADFAGGVRDKEFSQRRWQGDRMVPGGFEPIPFQLPAVLDAVRSGRTIYVVEGEKDVLSAQAAGLTATCNAGGALAWSEGHALWLEGAATVVVVADRDAPGYRRAEKVTDSLRDRVARVRVVAAATGKDLTDHLACGHEVSELEPVPGLDPYTPLPAAAPHGAAAGREAVVSPSHRFGRTRTGSGRRR